MKMLLVAATESEIGIFQNYLALPENAGRYAITTLITGVGSIATAFAVTRALTQNTYDFVLQAGVGGSFNKALALGDLVLVTTEKYGDLGAEDHDTYIDIFDMGLIAADVVPHSGGLLKTPLHPIHDTIKLQHASGLTVNQVSGNEKTIAHRSTTYKCDIESMEGAAFHYVCLQMEVPFAQVRAISNYVIPRDKGQWQMKDAIVNLNKWLIAFVEGWQRGVDA